MSDPDHRPQPPNPDREQLEQNAAMLRIAGKVARLGGWTIELPERKLTWSDETCLIHDLPPGYQPSLEEGLSMFPPEHRAEVIRCVEACERDGTSYDYEVQKITASGRRIWVRGIGEAVRDVSGKIIRLQGAFQDITERKQVELALARSNRALRMLSFCNEALIRAADEKQLLGEICRLAVETGGYRMAWAGYAENDERKSITPIAHAGEERGYLGEIHLCWSETEASGRGPAGRTIRNGEVVYSEDITHDSAGFHWQEAALERGYRSVICLPLREGRHTFGLLGLYSGEIHQPGPDEIKLLQGLADNLAFGISNLRAREQGRKAQQEIAWQAALLDQATDAIFLRDLEHRVTYWNKGAERMYGWAAFEAVGKTVSELLDGGNDQKAIKQVLATGGWAGELHKTARDGRQLVIEARWTLVRNAMGAAAAILSIDTDITERKKLEAQFLRAQRMESIGTLAGGIAHDLNNVLAPVLMSIEFLRMTYRDEEADKALQSIQASAQRGADLVRQVLSFARGVEGRRVPVNVVHLIRELHKVAMETFPKSIDVRVKLPGEPWNIVGDATQLHQVFLNLCVNARDAMAEGGVLSIKVENVSLDEVAASRNPEAWPGDYVVVTVSDTGEGISEEIQHKIFEPFFTTKDVGEGTGLGLSTAIAIVKSHGGFITLHSEPGRGAEFKVFLPAEHVEAREEKQATPQNRLPRGNGELVLVVDDEESIRRIARTTLRCFGYEVLVASDGLEALDLYKEHGSRIAVVLTDMAMPVMDGAALINALRSWDPMIRVIGSSGLVTQETAVDKGIKHFITKPYTAEAMLGALQKALAKSP